MQHFTKLSLLVAGSLIIFLSSCKKEGPGPAPSPTPTPAPIFAPPDFGFKVVGYFPYYRSVAAVPDVKFKMTNVVNYAFFTVTATGLTLNNPSVFTAEIGRAHV